MAQYMLLLKGGDFGGYSPEEAQKIVEKYIVWANQLREKGIHRGGDELKGTGRVLSVKNGRVVDGPFTETKEAIGGYFQIEVESMEEAVEISKGCPHLEFKGDVEIREVNPH